MTSLFAIASNRTPVTESVPGPAGDGATGIVTPACVATVTGRPDAPRTTSEATGDGSTLIAAGEIYDSASGDPLDAAEVLTRYAADGSAALVGLEGRFVLAIRDERADTLTVANDKFGSRPLYLRRLAGGVAFGTSLRTLASIPGEAARTDVAGVVQFLSFGHLWNETTFDERLRAFAAATVATYRVGEDRLETEVYWRPAPSGLLSPAEAQERLAARFDAAVECRVRDADGIGVALSGGLDARSILAAIPSDVASRTACVSLGMPGSLDQDSARRLAAAAGSPFHTVTLDSDFLGAFERHFEGMTRLTDGHYLSQCIVMPTLPRYRELGITKLLRGHAGELLHMHKAYNFSVDRSFPRADDAAGLGGWLAPRLRSFMLDGVGGRLFRDVTPGEAEAIAAETLRDGLARTENFDDPFDRLSLLFLDQRTRRETAMSMTKFDSVVEPRLPYLDGPLIETVFATPRDVRIGERLQTAILSGKGAKFLRPANSNTGAPVGSGPWTRRAATLRMKFLAKLRVRGYQPYERLGEWLRVDLAGFVERVLLDEAFLDAGPFRPDTVRAVVADHLAGRRNHTFLVIALMVLARGGWVTRGVPEGSPVGTPVGGPA